MAPEPNARRAGRRSVVPGLPRTPTFKRMQSEKRERLRPYEPPLQERRAHSADRRGSENKLTPVESLPIEAVVEESQLGGLIEAEEEEQQPEKVVVEEHMQAEPEAIARESVDIVPARDPRESEPQIISASEEGLSESEDDDWAPKEDKDPPHLALSKEIEDEMEWRWILNLSMHFRDESNREKFFVTYAQEKNSVRRRITISCDYRNAEDGTLEKDLCGLRFQRDKSAKIYEAIRDSLQDIMFYETITNLKLQTSDGRLHVHVTEDLNEIIPYPPVQAIAHLRCPKYRESDLIFDSHLSGFVYKVGVKGEIMIKKEIPGPDTVDEFLYEINALYALADSDNVIQFGGCIVDDQRQRVKGLLISYASKGALIDILFNQRGKLPWPVREKWAKQIVSGLSEIHEAGYVQGDFTLSNIVIDSLDNAKIIDINRRGCPVGWEPPEITSMIEGLQRIGMYIGVKSDVFQLGMVLWGMAHEMDEPEAMPRPLTMDQAPDDVPAYFRSLVEACLCDRPQGRPSAKDMIALFPEHTTDAVAGIDSGNSSGAGQYEDLINGSSYFSERPRRLLNGEVPPSPPPPLRSPLTPPPQTLESINTQSPHSSFPPLSRQTTTTTTTTTTNPYAAADLAATAHFVPHEDGDAQSSSSSNYGPENPGSLGGVGLPEEDSRRSSGVMIPRERLEEIRRPGSGETQVQRGGTTGTESPRGGGEGTGPEKEGNGVAAPPVGGVATVA